MANLSSDLLVELECPVCTEFMCPPIRQCSIGHSMCDFCYKQLTSCPTCRGPKGEARSFSLENLYEKFIIPCRNRFDGCNFVDIGRKIKEHEEYCFYGEKECPLKNINGCQWFDRVKNLIGHCKEKHPENMFKTNKQRLTCTNFSDFKSRKACYCIIFDAYDELFKCCWEIQESGLMKWCVYFLGLPVNAINFSYEIEIIDQNCNKHSKKTLSFRSSCKPFTGSSEGLEAENCILMHFNMVNKFCKIDTKELMYEVRIIIESGMYKLFNLR